MSVQSSADQLPQVALRPITLAWVLKRTAIAVCILFVVISAMAWLTYASIDPSLESHSADEATATDLTKVNFRY